MYTGAERGNAHDAARERTLLHEGSKPPTGHAKKLSESPQRTHNSGMLGRLVNHLFKSHQQSAPAYRTVGELINAFYEMHWRHLDSETVRNIDSVLGHHLRPQFGSAVIGELQRADVVAWHKSRRDVPSRANKAVGLARHAWEELLPDLANPFARVTLHPERERERRLTEDERARFWAELGQMRVPQNGRKAEVTETVADAIWCIRLAGSRPGEMMGLLRRQVDLHAQIAILEIHKTDRESGVRIIPLSGCIDVIRKRCDIADRTGNKFLFPSTKSRSGHIERIDHAFHRACERAGIVPSWDLVPHSLRGELATQLTDEGIDLRVVQKVLGHANPATTARYARPSNDTAQRAVSKASAKMGRAPW